MAIGKQVNIRIGEGEQALLQRLAGRSGAGLGDVLRSLIPPGDVVERIERLAEIDDVTAADAIAAMTPASALIEIYRLLKPAGLAPNGLGALLLERAANDVRAEMMNHPQYPIDKYFLRGTTPEAALVFYGDFLRAVDRKAGLSHAHPITVHLEQVPTGGVWERNGVTGWCVLPDSQRFTKDGTERLAG